MNIKDKGTAFFFRLNLYQLDANIYPQAFEPQISQNKIYLIRNLYFEGRIRKIYFIIYPK